MSPKSAVLVVYGDATARDTAVQFCDSLVQRFWQEFSFELGWCHWSRLKNRKQAQEFAQRAAEAEVLVIATGTDGKLPFHIRRWIELSLRDRAEREGVLVGLPMPETGWNPDAAATQLYLRKLAHENGMDYLTAVPEGLPQRFPESTESYNLRATQVTSVLDTILHQSPFPRML